MSMRRIGFFAIFTIVAAGFSACAAETDAPDEYAEAGDTRTDSDAPDGDAADDPSALAQQGTAPGTLAPITLWIAGDSTVSNYPASDAPQEGWGQEIGTFFTTSVKVNNQALGGRSTRTFMFNNVKCVNNAVTFTGGKPDEAGTRWERIKNNIVAGDYLLIQFGHNDGGSVCERKVGIPEYKKNLTTMVKAARDRRATPILITPMSQLSQQNGQLRATLTNYAAAMKEVAAAEKVELVDLNNLSIAWYRQVGFSNLQRTYFMPNDSTHFTKRGATELSRLITTDMKKQAGALAPYLK